MPMVGKTSTFSNHTPTGGPFSFTTTTINSAPSAVFGQTWLSDTSSSAPTRFVTLIQSITRRRPDGTNVSEDILAPTFFRGDGVTSVTYLAAGGRLTAVNNYEFWA